MSDDPKEPITMEELRHWIELTDKMVAHAKAMNHPNVNAFKALEHVANQFKVALQQKAKAN